jgi:hypothetical protein
VQWSFISGRLPELTFDKVPRLPPGGKTDCWAAEAGDPDGNAERAVN